jgi:hypothetical protein
LCIYIYTDYKVYLCITYVYWLWCKIMYYIYVYIHIYILRYTCSVYNYTIPGRVLYFICVFIEVDKDQDPGTDNSSCHLSRWPDIPLVALLRNWVVTCETIFLSHRLWFYGLDHHVH